MRPSAFTAPCLWVDLDIARSSASPQNPSLALLQSRWHCPPTSPQSRPEAAPGLGSQSKAGTAGVLSDSRSLCRPLLASWGWQEGTETVVWSRADLTPALTYWLRGFGLAAQAL